MDKESERKMRRKDREIIELDQIVEIMKKCDVCRLAFFDREFPYIVPLNFGMQYDGNTICLYFHGAREGKKLDLIQENNKASFEMDCAHRLITGERACDYSMEYESVIGQGILEILSETEKRNALDIIMRQYSGEKEFEYNENYLKAVTVFKLMVTGVTGKRLKK